MWKELKPSLGLEDIYPVPPRGGQVLENVAAQDEVFGEIEEEILNYCWAAGEGKRSGRAMH